MSLLSSILLGLVQGIAEFLPISSSGHLAIAEHLLNVSGATEIPDFFDVLLHLGTLVAVFVAYWSDIRDMIQELICGARDLARRSTPDPIPPARRLILLIIVGTLPLFLILPVNDLVEQLYYHTFFIGLMLILTGFLLFVADKMPKGTRTEKTMRVRDALVIGVCQAVATIPGLSRSGTTIAAGMATGLDRSFAVRFSFLMSLPAVLGANILSLAKAAKAGIDVSLLPAYLAGMLVAMVSGVAAIGLVKRLTSKGRFGAFSYYCWGAGALTMILSLIF